MLCRDIFFHDDLIHELVYGSHLSCFHACQFIGLRVLGKDLFERSLIIQRFRDDDLQKSCFIVLMEHHWKNSGHRSDHEDKKQRDHQISHSGSKAYRQCQEQTADLPRCSRSRAETDQAESSGYRHTGAKVAVDQHDDDLYDHWDQTDREQKSG